MADCKNCVTDPCTMPMSKGASGAWVCCGYNQRQTNSDKMDSMTLEEKVAFLCIDNCNYCVFWNAELEHCTDQKSKKKPETLGCAEGHRRWLNQRAK